jgi:hypothetical protein
MLCFVAQIKNATHAPPSPASALHGARAAWCAAPRRAAPRRAAPRDRVAPALRAAPRTPGHARTAPRTPRARPPWGRLLANAHPRRRAPARARAAAPPRRARART